MKMREGLIFITESVLILYRNGCRAASVMAHRRWQWQAPATSEYRRADAIAMRIIAIYDGRE